MAEDLFDLTEKYEAMLHQGIGLSGEDQHYFIRGRLQDLKKRLPAGWMPQRILDFGCGIGHTARELAALYPHAKIQGLDTSEKTLSKAAERHGSASVSFDHIRTLPTEATYDLCFVNGVFHHIDPSRWLDVLTQLRKALLPGGYLALFENNPWNPGTHWVMRRIPFDRDAVMMSVVKAAQLIRQAGFAHIHSVRSLFYFPKMLSFLRILDPLLNRMPLGAQYSILARKT